MSSSSNTQSIRKIYSNSNCKNETRLNNPQYFVSTPNQIDLNVNQTSGRVIIAKAHPQNDISQINSNSNNNLGAPLQFQFNSSDGTLYTGSNSFFQSQSNNSSDIYSHSIFSSNGSYFVSSLDNPSQALTHTTRASPTTIQWLVENFEPAEGCSLRRSILYSFYLQHCSEQKLESVNPASFGKLIRSVFLGLRTRRLGTRGNSKYHYYGIRLKLNSSFQIYSDQNGKFNKTNLINLKIRHSSNSDDQSSPENKPFLNDQSYLSQSQNDTKQFLDQNNSSSSFFLNQFINIDSLPQTINIQIIKSFENSYKEHLNKLFSSLTTLDFSSVEEIILNYWSDKEFHTICSLNCVENFVINCDYQFYEQLIQRLIEDILSPMPESATQSIRTFAKNIDGWLRKALIHLPERMQIIKLTIVNGFSMTLRRYTSLNHLAQAARSVLNNCTQVNQMLADLNKVDFSNIQEQSWWVCQCDCSIISRIEKEFKSNLSCQLTLEEWSQWLNCLLNDLMKSSSNLCEETYEKQGKQILLNWSFYCSMVVRDLTLRSATSFGSFHLLRLLYDEYLFYLIEHKIALYTQRSTIAVITQLTLENKLSRTDLLNPRRNIPSKISLVVKKDSFSQAKIVTLPNGSVQLPIFNKLVSAAKLAHQQATELIEKESDSVKRLKTSDEIMAI